MKEKILIVEDEPNMRKTLSSILQQEGYYSLDTGKAKEGLKILQSERSEVTFANFGTFADFVKKNIGRDKDNKNENDQNIDN